jgi:orotate phosphoribosyltransferase
VARQIVLQIGSKADIVIGPETLGRTLAELTAAESGKLPGIWCGFEGEGNDKRAVFAANLNFGRLLAGKHVAIVDDLLTTGSSVKLVSDLVLANGGIPVMVVVVVRRTPEISHKECHVLELDVLADVPGFEVFTEQQCAEYGPCSRREAITLRPGHGWKWIEDHPGYPVVDSKP